jgi:hypothetical protein
VFSGQLAEGIDQRRRIHRSIGPEVESDPVAVEVEVEIVEPIAASVGEVAWSN